VGVIIASRKVFVCEVGRGRENRGGCLYVWVDLGLLRRVWYGVCLVLSWVFIYFMILFSILVELHIICRCLKRVIQNIGWSVIFCISQIARRV
jgi:hypothetical protein